MAIQPIFVIPQVRTVSLMPIEYVYSSAKSIVSQREVHSDTHSWDIALRSICERSDGFNR